MIGISLDIPEVAARGGGWSPPLIGTTAPDIFGDFAAIHYSSGATKYASFSAWLTGISGTYSRASNATYLQSGVIKTATSGTARFPSDINGVPTGLRLTGSATNLTTQSQFVSGWIAGNITLTANAVVSPDGTTNAASFIPTVANSVKDVFGGSNTIVNGSVYTFSVFAKAAGYNFVALDMYNMSGTNTAIFSLSGSGSVIQSGAYTNVTITQLANGWFRLSTTGTSATTSATNLIYVANTSNLNPPSTPFIADGVSGIFAYGAQLELGSFATDYIPTTTATVTQAGDLFTFPFAQTAFTVLAGTNGVNVVNGGPVNATIFADNASSNVYLYANGVSVSANPVFATYNNTDWVLGPAVSGTFLTSHKSAAAGNNSGRAITSDGLTPNSDAHTFVSAAASTAALGSVLGGTQSLNGNLSMFAVWNGLVASNANLQALTT